MDTIKIIGVIVILFTVHPVWGQKDSSFQPIFDKNVFQDDTKQEENTTFKNKFSFEVYSENGYNSDTGWYSKDAVGFEYYGIASDNKGDFLDINLQMRFFFNSEWLEESHPFAYGDFSTWADFNKVIQFHNAYLRFRFLQGYLNTTIGHYDNLYGLEVDTDTHSTMIQKLVFYDLNMKKDWGIVFSGQADAFDWWLSYTIGSGLGIHWEGDQYLLSARIATPQSTTVFGFSALYGKVLPVMGPNLRAQTSLQVLRFVADVKGQWSEFTLESEVAGGWTETYTRTATSLTVNSWQPDIYTLIHLHYKPADLTELQLTLGPRVELVNVSNLKEDSLIALESYIQYQWFSELKVELGFIPELYHSDSPEEWEVKLLAYLSI